jgi:protein-arginine kinase
VLDNMVQSQPANEASVAMVLAFEYNDKFGFVTADPSVLGTAMDCEVPVDICHC